MRFLLSEDAIPSAWFNVLPVMPEPLQPPLHPGTGIEGGVMPRSGGFNSFSWGEVRPETLGVAKSVDGLVMVLLGGVHAVSGPWAGAALFTRQAETIAAADETGVFLYGLTPAEFGP